MKKWYLLMNKPDDYGNCTRDLYFGNKKTFKDYVYHYTEVPEEHIPVLKIYFDILNNVFDSVEALQSYLDENY